MTAPFTTRPASAARRLARLWAALLLVTLLAPAGRAAPAQAQGVPGPGVTAWKVTWSITANATHSETNTGFTSFTSRSTAIRGEATVTHLPSGMTQVGPYQLHVSDDLYASFRHFDERNSFAINKFSIADGGTHSSGLQPPLGTSHPFTPEQDESGSWYMSADPFGNPLFGMRDGGMFTYKTDITTHLGTSVMETTQQYYTQVLLNQVTSSKEIERIPGDPTGRFYELDETYTVTPESGGMGGDMENMPVRFRVSVRPANECSTLGSPIEASNPALSIMRDSIRLTLTPDEPFIPFDGESYVTAQLTCDGVPIKGAQLHLGADVVARSGFHGHHDLSRPRGWIETVKVTPANHLNVVQRTTNDKGEVEYVYLPGADTETEQSDISGTYRLRGFAPDFGAETWISIDAKVPGLVELPQQSDTHEAIGETFAHRQNHFGTPATIAAIPRMAERFVRLQNEMNDARARRGARTLPVLRAVFGDISLPWGGHFDTNSLHERSVFWRPPHKDHDMGEEVSTVPGAYLYRLVEAGMTYDEAEIASGTMDIMLHASLSSFGTWVSSNPPSLRVRQGQAVQSITTAATGASPAVVATLIGRGVAQNPVAARGQPVRVAIGYHNLEGGAPAPGATLTATLPEGLRYVGADRAPTTVSGRTITWLLGDLAAGALPEIIVLETAVEPGAALNSTLPVGVQLAAGADVSPADNQAQVAVTVQPLAPDLAVETSLADAPLVVGQATSFDVTVTNDGTSSATSPVLSLTLPDGAALASSTPAHSSVAAPRTYRWQLPALAPSESRTVTVNAALDPLLATLGEAAPPLRFDIVATVGGQADASPSDNELSVNRRLSGGPDLAVSLARLSKGAAGDEADYALNYVNIGDRPAAGTVATLTLGPGLALVSASPAPSATTPTAGGTVLRWDAGTLAPGISGSAVVRVRGLSADLRAEAVSAAHEVTTDNNLMFLRPVAGVAGDNPADPNYRVALPVVSR